ncbi:hypothetical protein PR048_024805 [Dryococelus australis]|uniref:Uncharacterized protein n=1 Tax=Dryococelus australis TaxID=614101 RepID=A0ABQ9GPL3_9NEOP|nr:hypothetical protein PR048_024805 [Dryococelus australis]
MLGFRTNDADVLKTFSVKYMVGTLETNIRITKNSHGLLWEEGVISYDRVIGVYSWDNVFVLGVYKKAWRERYVDDINIIDMQKSFGCPFYDILEAMYPTDAFRNRLALF